jgi:hypothetical protein
MTNEEFIDVLDRGGFHYRLVNGKVVVTHRGQVFLDFLTSLPPDVEFANGWNVHLQGLTSLPSGVVFTNSGFVRLDSIASLPSDVEFSNNSDVNLRSIASINSGVKFTNKGDVYLESLLGEVKQFKDWKGNIEGIDSKRLLNFMISKGVFEK